MKYAGLLMAAAAFAQTAAPPPQDAMRAAVEKQQAAIALQREAVRKQAASIGTRLLPWDPPHAMAGAVCDPIPDSVAAPLIDGAAQTHQLEPKLLRAVIEQESAFRPCAVSSKGAEGLMQLMPGTSAELAVQNPFDPKENIDAGAKYLKQLLDRFKGDLPQALGAYNAGPTAIGQAGAVPEIPETVEYVDAILQKLGITRTAQPNTPKPKPIGN